MDSTTRTWSATPAAAYDVWVKAAPWATVKAAAPPATSEPRRKPRREVPRYSSQQGFWSVIVGLRGPREVLRSPGSPVHVVGAVEQGRQHERELPAHDGMLRGDGGAGGDPRGLAARLQQPSRHRLAEDLLGQVI